MATFTWHATALGVENKTVDGHDDLVSIVYWECSATQETNGNTYAASLSRNTSIPYDSNHQYIAFADMTEEEALNWVFEQTIPSINKNDPAITVKTATENELQAMIDAQITPEILTPALPWA